MESTTEVGERNVHIIKPISFCVLRSDGRIQYKTESELSDIHKDQFRGSPGTYRPSSCAPPHPPPAKPPTPQSYNPHTASFPIQSQPLNIPKYNIQIITRNRRSLRLLIETSTLITIRTIFVQSLKDVVYYQRER